MEMTKNFSFARVLLLLKKQWIENIRFYLYATLALIGLLGVVFLFWLSTDGDKYDEDLLIGVFFLGLYLSGAIFASTSFNMLKGKAKSIYWLSFPASHLEKSICLIFYNFIVFTVIYCVCFFLLAIPTVAYIQELVSSNPLKYTFNRIVWSPSNNNFEACYYFSCGFFGIQALYLLGSIYFRRYSFILTTIIVAFVFFCFILYVKNLMAFFSADFQITLGHSFHASRRYIANNLKIYELNRTVSDVIVFLFKFIWAPFLWLVTWFRLTEKKVENRI